MVCPLAIAMILLLLFATSRQVAHWRNSETLFSWTSRATWRNALAEDNLGVYLCQMGRRAEGLRHLRLAAEYAPIAREFGALAIALLDHGELEEAEAWAEKARTANPAECTAWIALGGIACKRGNYPEAVNLLRRYLAIKPDDACQWDLLGDIQARQQRWPEAVDAWQQAFALNPALPGVREKLAQHAPQRQVPSF